MAATVDLPDDLYRRAKAEAAMSGRKLKDLVEEGLRNFLDASGKRPKKPASLAALMKRAQGMIDSGVPDLATNPKHMEGFGQKSIGR